MTEPHASLVDLVDRCFTDDGDVLALAPAIVSAARGIATRAAKALGLDDHDADDVAQHTSSRLVQMLERGERPRGNPEALVWRIAENRARDLHRSRRRRDEGKERLVQETSAIAEPVPDAEALWLSRERQASAQAQVREALARAPESYRVAIERHYLDGVPVEQLADQNFVAMVDAGEVNEADPASVASAKRKARNRADQHLKRGRDWLRKQLATLMTEEAE